MATIDEALKQVQRALHDLEQAQAGQQTTPPTNSAEGRKGLAEAERRYGKPTTTPTDTTPAPSENAKGHAEAVRRFGNRAGGAA